jgi:hypothetical protein
MKCPRQGIWSTRPKCSRTTASNVTIAKLPNIANDDDDNDKSLHFAPQGNYPHSNANVIKDNDDSTKDANLSCFAAFADKQMGTLYNDFTGAFPFISFEGNVCFLIVYHYESNAILALPILGFSNNVIFAAFKQQYKLLESIGFVIKFDMMDNQASNVRKQYLTPKHCELMLVEPNNHQVNAAERAIQTFKDHFVSALATTDSKFPLQLWDRLAPHVETLLNMLRPSRIDPTKSAYEVLNCPYNWDRFPLAPHGCKAVIYETPESHTSWGSCCTDAWYVGPSLNHYQCNQYFAPETRADRISGSVELFPQHCQVPYLMWNEHLQEVITELVTTLNKLPPKKWARVLTKVQQKLAPGNQRQYQGTLTQPTHKWLLPHGDLQLQPNIPPPEQNMEQRVENNSKHSGEHRVEPPLTRITDAPAIITAPNPTAPRRLRHTKQSHSC